MRTNYKNFLLGMLLALGPTLMWAESELNSSYKIIGKGTPGTKEPNTEVLSYNYFEPQTAVKILSTKDEITNEPEPTNTPIPTQTQKPLAKVAVQERKRIPTGTPAQYTAPAEIDAMINRYASEYGADPNLMKKIAKCESGYDPAALSPSGAYAGMYQFVAATWISNRNAMGLDPDPSLRYDAEESIKTAAFKMGRDGYGAWPVCSRI